MNKSWYGSPNFTAGRSSRMDTVMMHWMAGSLASTDAVFQDTNRQTSAHYGIENDVVHQYVKEQDTSWNAGSASWNARSIGIEHSAQPGRDASEATIKTSAQLLADICVRNGIPCDRDHVKKHNEVFPTQCPGTLPVDEIIKRANSIIQGDNMNMTSDDTAAFYQAAMAKQIDGNDNYVKQNTGKDFQTVVDGMLKSDPWKLRQAKANNYDALEAENANLKKQLASQKPSIADVKINGTPYVPAK